ncbi:MAG: ribonuclease R [Rubrivivax sp.]|jgi:ribonuclease R|nr:ribonuclease R [Rubrivivax sp.]
MKTRDETVKTASQALLSEVEGRIEGHRDGHGFVVRHDGEPSIYLPPQDMRNVMHGDTVRARILRYDRKGRPEGRVLDIVARREAPIIGRLLNEGGGWLVAPEDRRYGQDILIPKNGIGTALAGQVVSVELTEPPSLHAQPVGRVVEVLGDIDDPGMEIEIAVRKYAVPHQFSPATLAQAAALPDALRATDLRHRVDLRDVALVTIDGEDARDFDDAVYCEPYRWGRGRQAQEGWRLLVAIADVSHYVKPGEPLDADAYERATSVYFPRRVIPMLPEKLSNGLCSLNPNQDRLCMVCDMVVRADGEIEAYQFYPAVMHSQARFTYTEVAAILANTRGPEAAKRGPLVEHLIHLHEVYRALLKQRARRGAVDFETTETQIVCDDAGHILRIVPRTRNEAHRLIEESMLAANVCSAEFLQQSNHPALFRVHEGPTPEKRLALQNYLKALGLGFSLSDEPTPGELQAIAKATHDRPDAVQIHQMLLRSMQQAVYTPVNNGHFGLAYTAYTHFTSPIRRYPDLLVHRAIKAVLSKKKYLFEPIGKMAEAPLRRGAKPSRAAPKAAKDLTPWEIAGAHTSACERRADEASRDVEAWLKCKFMREHLGEEYSGTVSSVAAFGVFVTLDELYVDGLVHITELGGEYYKFDELRQELRGERSGMRYAVGTALRVQVSRVDLDGRRIDFRLVREADGERLLTRTRSGRAGAPAADAPVGEAGSGARGTVAPGSSAEAELQAIQQQDRQARAGARKARQSTARSTARAPGKAAGAKKSGRSPSAQEGAKRASRKKR